MTDPITTHTLPVLNAASFVVTDGVAEGDGLSFADELVLDDVYQLAQGVEAQFLTLEVMTEPGRYKVAPGSTIGLPDSQIVLDCCVTFMAPDSTTVEVLVLVELVADGVEDIHILPLSRLEPARDYRLVGVDRHTATRRFAEVACVSFTRGTRITMATGAQVPIEDLKVGDRVLTRDDGPQPIRWIGETTVRAIGEFAPVVISKGALHNENDLLVSPDHRLFVYQRQDRLGAGRHEVLVKVRHLINGDTVYRQDGGFVDYFQLLFDEHHIIYAEGIAAESLLLDPRTRAALPDSEVTPSGGTAHAHRPHLDYEIKESLLSSADAVDLLRRASKT